jgi:FkbM family methyltransferase
LGRRTLTGLRAAGIEPLAFSDNSEGLWGAEIDGLEVLSPADAAHQHGANAAFVVTIWGAGSPHRFEHSVSQLGQMGCDVVLPVTWLYWRYSAQLLPFYALDVPSSLLEQASEVRRCFDLLADDRSKEEFVSQVRWRLFGDPGCLSSPVPEEQYLVADVARAHSGEVVLDCGAYDGDTLRSWLAVRGPTFRRYFAMEPDPLSRDRLEMSLAELDAEISDRIQVLPYSVSNFTGTGTFSASGSLSSALAEGIGSMPVQCVRIDDLQPELGGHDLTFLKMDVEGSELDALAGGSESLRRLQPLIAIATYHRQDHLWRVPLAISELSSDYRYHLRPHNEEGWDLILYAVPESRSLAA